MTSRLAALALERIRSGSRSSIRVARAGALGALCAVLVACGSSGDDGAGAPGARGELVELEQTGVLTRAQIDAEIDRLPILRKLIGGASRCDVVIHRIAYRTIAPDGSAARASAGVATPTACPAPFPLLVYHHGTEARSASRMSDPDNGETLFNAAFFASQGYVVVMPDYHGYGDSSLGWHPYLHAENTAAVSIDAIRAARKALDANGVVRSAKLFIWGYSQGGHAAMATQRAIERDHSTEFSITASAPASGPYALARTVREIIVAQTEGASVIAPMLFVGLQRAYGDLYRSPGELFQPPWDASVESLLPGPYGFSELVELGKLPAQLVGAGGLLTDAFVSAFLGEPSTPARVRVAQNETLGWRPVAPTLLCGGSRDPVVPFFNTIDARDDFAARGAAVTAIDVELDQDSRLIIEFLFLGGVDLSDYHAGIVPALCAAIIKRDHFDPRR